MATVRRAWNRSNRILSNIHNINNRCFSLFGPSESDWKKWAKEFEIQDAEEDENKKRDPREVTAQELRDVLRLQGKFLIESSMIPTLELPEASESWYTDNHIYIQQTNLDDIWRMGYSPIRFTGTRHVEWLVYDSEATDIKLYSEAIMWFSICDWKPLKIIGQSINDIQFTMQSPFHRIKVVSINEKIESNPSMMIDDEVDINWRWILTFQWINNKEEIFSKPPIHDGRYGRWFDKEQYIEWLKDTGQYKKWQIDQVEKMAEDKRLKFMDRNEKSAKETRFEKHGEEMMKQQDGRPKYLRLDDEMRGIKQDDDEKASWKPKWFPF